MLTTDLLHHLYKNYFHVLDLEEKIFVIPKVCRSWHDAFEKELENNIFDYIQKNFKPVFNNEELKNILQTYKKISLISLFNHYVSPTNIFTREFSSIITANFQQNAILKKMEVESLVNSSEFHLSISLEETVKSHYCLIWKFKKYHFLKTKQYFREKSKLMIILTNLEKFNVTDAIWRPIRKFHFFPRHEDTETLKTEHYFNTQKHIKKAFEIELMLHIHKYSFFNYIFINKIELNNNPEFKISFKCDKKGVILDQNSTFFYSIFTITKSLFLKEEKDQFSHLHYLTWDSDCKQKTTSITPLDTLRWSVFSKTVSYIAKKLNIEIQPSWKTKPYGSITN